MTPSSRSRQPTSTVGHPATIVPTKMELLQAWVPDQPWLGGADASTLTRVGSYRFDDPDGEVGIETHLVRTGDGQVLQVPLTYHGAPCHTAKDALITTMTHTTLGDRWIYDACHDPVYVRALVTAIMTGGAVRVNVRSLRLRLQEGEQVGDLLLRQRVEQLLRHRRDQRGERTVRRN